MSRFTKEDQALMTRVGKALGYKAVREKGSTKKKKTYTVFTPFGTLRSIEAASKKAAVEKHLPEFLEDHEGLLLRWLGKQALRYDFTLSIKILTDDDGIPFWRVLVATKKAKKACFGRPHLAFISRPLCEAIDYVQKEIIGE